MADSIAKLERDCIGDSVDPDEPKETFGSSGSTESPIQSRYFQSKVILKNSSHKMSTNVKF
jgi:hypothetical protein